MHLNELQVERINYYVPIFQQYLDSSGRNADIAERHERYELFQTLLSPDAIGEMTELEFGQMVSALWASQIWGNKTYFVKELIEKNGLPRLKEHLNNLLWSNGPLSQRYDAFRRSIVGLGTASITEMLAFVYPQQCGLWNNKARRALEILGFSDTFSVIRKSQISGDEYQKYNELLHAINQELQLSGIDNLDLLGVDYFLYEVWQSGKNVTELVPVVPLDTNTRSIEDYDHDEVIEQLVAIGQWLGFDAKKEVGIAKGARVDAVWQARIANLGVVTYVFEVQRRGSVDSLILNLQRALNNPSVQRLIVIANSIELARIREEITTLQESFRKSISYVETKEIIRAFELFEELSGIVNKFELVHSEFGT